MLKAKALGYSFVILISAAIVFTDLYFRVLAGKELTPIEGARLVPQEALTTIYISTDSQMWNQLDEVGTPEVQKIVRQKIKSWIDQVAVLEGISYQRSIQPWIGNVMLAYLPSRKAAPEPKNWLMVVGIRNKFKAFEFANLIEKQNTKTVQASQYKNIPIVYVTNKNEQTTIVAVLNQYVFVSSDQKTIEKAIDNLQSRQSLDLRLADQFSQEVGKNLIAQVYLPNYFNWLESEFSASELNQISPAILQELSQLKSAFVEISIHDLEVHLQAIAKRRSLDDMASKGVIGTHLEPLDVAQPSALVDEAVAKLNQIAIIQNLLEKNSLNAEELQQLLFLTLGVSFAEIQTSLPSSEQLPDPDWSILTNDNLNWQNRPEAAAIAQSIQSIDIKTATLDWLTSQIDLLITLKPQSR